MIAYFLGLSAGLVPALSTGPVFLTLVQKSIRHGFKKTIYFILGVALTDTTIIALTWLGLSKLSDDEPAPIALTIAGGLILVIFGLVIIFKKEKRPDKVDIREPAKLQGLGLFTQAVMLNVINPVIWGFWAAISNYAITEFNDANKEVLFFTGVLNMVWITDLLKAYYAQKLNQILTDKFKRNLNIAIGALLIGFGLKLLGELVI